MSLHSAPYGSTDVLYSPPQRPYIRERSLTLPRRNQTKVANRSVRLANTISCEENKPLNNQEEKLRFSSVSSDGNNQTPDNSSENWDKLKEMMRQVEDMKGVVDHLFQSVEVCNRFTFCIPIKSSRFNYISLGYPMHGHSDRLRRQY